MLTNALSMMSKTVHWKSKNWDVPWASVHDYKKRNIS